MKNIFKNKTILVTGGTGSFGKAFIKKILSLNLDLKKIIIFSRDEMKQYEMSAKFNSNELSKLRFFIGDVRDKSRLSLAIREVDIVIHAAALKQVPSAEYNPLEYIKTNIYGAQNIVETCLNSNVENVIALSTDKASSPTNLYGATKLCSDKLFISANQLKGKQNIKFSVVRYGNVLASRGSVANLFLKQMNSTFTITDKRMTRFSITLNDAVDFVINRLKDNYGGEIFVPKLPSYNIIDFVKAFKSKTNIKYIGIRSGEKLHEEMISVDEGRNCYEAKNYYVIISPELKVKYKKIKKLKKVKDGFFYNSFLNKNYLKIPIIRKILINEKILPIERKK